MVVVFALLIVLSGAYSFLDWGAAAVLTLLAVGVGHLGAMPGAEDDGWPDEHLGTMP